MKYWKKHKVKRFISGLFPFVAKKKHDERVRYLQGQISVGENRMTSAIAEGVKAERNALDTALRQITSIQISPPIEGENYRLTMFLTRNIFRGATDLNEIGYIADHFARNVRFKVMELFTGDPQRMRGR